MATTSRPPLITLNISLSPLLSDAETFAADGKESLMSALLTKRTLSPLMGEGHWLAKGGASAPSAGDRLEFVEHTPKPDMAYRNQLLDPKDTPQIPTPRLRSQSVIALLNLLDRADADVADQVARTRDNIRELADDVQTYRQERQERLEVCRKKREQEKNETKEVGSDFWAGV